MVKKIGDNKIGRVDASDVASEVKSAGTVQGVDPVRPTGAVERTNSVGGVNKRRATRVMTLAEREELFKLVSEEAERMFPEGTLPAQKRKLIEVDVEKGAPDGKRYVFTGESDEFPGVEPGDIVVELMLEKHSSFVRKGADLVYNLEITLLVGVSNRKLWVM